MTDYGDFKIEERRRAREKEWNEIRRRNARAKMVGEIVWWSLVLLVVGGLIVMSIRVFHVLERRANGLAMTETLR